MCRKLLIFAPINFNLIVLKYVYGHKFKFKNIKKSLICLWIIFLLKSCKSIYELDTISNLKILK